MNPPTDDGLSRRGFLGLLAAGAGIGVAAGYGISQGFRASNPSGVDFSRKTVYFTDPYGFEVYAVHVSTGAVRWARPLSAYFLAVGKGTVYATNYDNHVYALDAGTGQIEWTRRIRPPGKAAGGAGASLYPSVSGDFVYIAADDGFIYALNAATGHLQWWHQISSYPSQSPIVYRGIVYVGSPDSYVYALDAKSGRFRWRFGNGGHAYTGLLAVAQDLVFAKGAAHLYALDPRSGQRRGTYPPALPSSNGIVYAGSASGYLQARDILRSRILWTHRAKKVQWLRATIAGNTLYVGANNLESCCSDYVRGNWVGAAVALNSVTGRSIWIYNTPEPISAPLVADGIVYLPGQWNLYALDAETGQARWIYATSEGVGSTLAVG